MKIKVLFSYTESIIPPRCRKPRDVLLHDGVLEVEIKEVSLEEAPVAMRVHTIERRKHLIEHIDLRWHNNQLWTNVNISNNMEPHQISSDSERCKYEMFDEEIDLRDGRYDVKSKIRYSTVKWKAQNQIDIENQLNHWLIIGNELYKSSYEPYYEVNTFGLGNNHGGTGLFVEGGSFRALENNCFNINQFGRAKKFAEEIANRRGDTKSIPMQLNGPNIEVFIPESVQLKRSDHDVPEVPDWSEIDLTNVASLQNESLALNW